MDGADTQADCLPYTPGSVVRATIFGHRDQLAALTVDVLDPRDNMPWTPLDEDTVGERYVAWSDLKDVVVLFDAGALDA